MFFTASIILLNGFTLSSPSSDATLTYATAIATAIMIIATTLSAARSPNTFVGNKFKIILSKDVPISLYASSVVLETPAMSANTACAPFPTCVAIPKTIVTTIAIADETKSQNTDFVPIRFIFSLSFN